MFKWVPIKEMREMQTINCGQVFQSLANDLQNKLKYTISAHSNMTGENIQYTRYIELLNNVNALRFENWSVEVYIQCDDENVRKLLKLSSDERYVVLGFRGYKMGR
jgi:hypothetical protein